jgi:hypothetical protein
MLGTTALYLETGRHDGPKSALRKEHNATRIT